MMLSVMVVGAGAAFSDQSKIKNTEAVDMCVALNIISGYPDGSYKPEGNITRAEFAKMICVLLNGGTTPATATNTTPTFNDVRGNANAAWAEGFIEYCYAKGIVSGVGGGKFAPNGNVTATEAAKMLLVALGYNATVENYTGASWALKVNVQANQDGLYKGLETIDTGAALTRDNAAQMVWNALQAYVIDKSSSIDRTDGSVTDIYTKSDSVDLIAKMYDGIIAKGELSAFKYNSKDAKWTYTVTLTDSRTVYNDNDEPITVPGDVKVVSKTDYTALLGQKVKAVYKYDKNAKENTVYGIFSVDSEVLLNGTIGVLPNISNGTATSFKIDGTTYKTDEEFSKTPVYQFGPEKAYFLPADSNLYAVAGQDKDGNNIIKYDSQKFEAVDSNGNGKIDFFMVYPVSVAKVTAVSKTNVKLQVVKKDTDNVAEFGYGVNTSVDVDDATIYDGVAKGDYVAYTAAKNTANDTEVLVKADLVSGKITKKSSNDVTIGGKVYTVDATYSKASSVGSTLTDAVVVNGYIFDADSTASADATDYVVAVSAAQTDYGDNTVKLLFSDNTKKVVTLDGAQSVTKGALYTYETNSDGEYTLTPVAAMTGKNVTKKSNSSSKVAYIDGNAVLDDSVIFIKYDVTKDESGAETSASYKVITGATLKTMGISQFGASKDGADCVYYVNSSNNSSTGVGDVNFAYITTTASSISSSDEFYGYITNIDEVKNSDNKTVKALTMWTNKGEVVLNTKANLSTTGLTDNTVIVYTLNSDGDIDSISKTNVKTGAVTKITESFMAINGQTANQYFDDDCIFVTIETDETAGVASECTYKDVGTADSNNTANVYYVIDSSDKEVVFVAYDVDNVITTNP